MHNFSALLYAALLCGSALAAQAETPALNSTEAPAATTLTQQNAAQEATANTADTADGTLVSFAPTDGARFERLLTSQSSNSINGDAVSIRTIRTQVEERWEKSGDKWLLHCTPTDVNVQNKITIAAKVEETLLSQPYTIVFNSGGEVIEVRGFDDISQKLKDALPQDTDEHPIPLPTTESMRARVALSQNYQFNWLYGQSWKLGELYKEQTNLPINNSEQITVDVVVTITAIDSKVLILSFQTETDASSENITATITTQSGQLQQLHRTRQLEVTSSDATMSRKSTEVMTITWTRAD